MKNRKPASRPLKDHAVHMELQRQLYRGGTYKTCPSCDGSGGRDGSWCTTCKGSGKVAAADFGRVG